MVTGKTKSGFEYKYDEEVTKEWEFMKAIAGITGDNNTQALAGMVNAVKMLLGDQEKALIDHVKSKNNGSATLEEVMKEFNEILEGNKETKN